MEERENFFDPLQEVYNVLAEDRSKDLVDLIHESCKKHEISERQLCSILGVNRSTIRRILNGEAKKLDVLTFMKLVIFLELDVTEALKLYASRMEKSDYSELEKSRRSDFVVKNFNLPALKKLGFIESATDILAAESRVLEFFNLKSIFEFNRNIGTTLFSSPKITNEQKIREFWLKCVYEQFNAIANPNPYDVEKLYTIIPQMRQYSRKEDKGLLIVIKALFSAGVTVIAQPYIPGTAVRGATFLVNEKPCIVITDFNARYDTVWFALMHEICHVLKDIKMLESTGFHLSGEIDLTMNEERANRFARKYFISDEKMGIIPSIVNIPSMVNQYAKQWGIHSSIIYGFYLYDISKTRSPEFVKSQYALYRKKIANSKNLFNELFKIDWSAKSLTESIEPIKKILNSLNLLKD